MDVVHQVQLLLLQLAPIKLQMVITPVLSKPLGVNALKAS